jgi:hypothetical protein
MSGAARTGEGRWPGIQAFCLLHEGKAWMPGPSPGMTRRGRYVIRFVTRHRAPIPAGDRHVQVGFKP